ncbi:MAG: TIM barrel protein [Cyclobacteriaceae bacterium]|nr:TIM barrel protein [Cyclobacteriaceae bacterium]
MKRKEALSLLGAGVAVSTLGAPAWANFLTTKNIDNMKLKGNINHSACRWCYGKIPMEQFLEGAKAIGLKGIDLLGPGEWKLALDKGMTCSMSTGDKFGIENGFNDPSLHQALYDNYASLIPKAADMGIKNIICFSGNRNGLSEAQGLENCAKGLEPLAKLAQQHGVYLVMELLNSKVNHPDYQCDHTAWGAALCEKLGSDHFKLLYDIYHMQIMEGDVIATIRKYHPYINHYHTGGVPGRNEINETQELYYPAIMKAILETGFDGFVAQEFVPTWSNPLEALAKGVEICDV